MSISRILSRFDGDVESYSSAQGMPVRTREAAALRVLAGDNVTQLAAEKHVSRQFLYKQENIAIQVIDCAFARPVDDDERVLFTIQITKALLRQIVVALVLRCHSSLRGVVAFLADVFDFDLSLGSVHNFMAEATLKARAVNQGENLASIKVAAHDEIYQAGHPVLVGMDCASTYCFLLEAAEHCDIDTWGYYLLVAKDQGLNLEYIVADQGKAQRAGLSEAFPGVPCGIDLFHIVRDFGEAIRYFENRHRGAFNKRIGIDAKMERLRRVGQHRNKCSRVLGVSRAKEQKVEGLVDDLTLLLSWLKDDVLAVGGMSLAHREELLDFIVDELRRRENKCQKVTRLRCLLEHAKVGLLSCARRVDELLDGVALTIDVARPLLDQMAIMLGCDLEDAKRYELEAILRRSLRDSSTQCNVPSLRPSHRRRGQVQSSKT